MKSVSGAPGLTLWWKVIGSLLLLSSPLLSSPHHRFYISWTLSFMFSFLHRTWLFWLRLSLSKSSGLSPPVRHLPSPTHSPRDVTARLIKSWERRAQARQMDKVGRGGRIATQQTDHWRNRRTDKRRKGYITTDGLIVSHRCATWIPAVSPRRSAFRATPWMRIYSSLLRSADPNSPQRRWKPAGTNPNRPNRSWRRWWRTQRRADPTLKESCWERYGDFMLRVSPLHGALDQTQGFFFFFFFLQFFFFKTIFFFFSDERSPGFKHIIICCPGVLVMREDWMTSWWPVSPSSLSLSLPVCASLLNESGARCARLPVRTDDWHHFIKARESCNGGGEKESSHF